MTAPHEMPEPADSEFEQILHCSDERTGLDSVIAIHDTTLGPSLGGIRMRSYPDHAAATADAKRLAEAMSYKSALAGLDLGGGKSVINAAPASADRRELLLAHARHIESLGGRYIPAVDMGTTVADLDLVGTIVSTVSSRRRDPSDFTAGGVVAAIRAALWVTEGSGLSGTRVAIQGLGHVGAQIAALLAAEGARLVVADINDAVARRVQADTGATVVAPSEILAAEADVLCPCAAGGVVTAELAETLTTRYVIGAANNLLAEPAVAAMLRARRIVHVPDFVANAGGLIACAAEVQGDDSDLPDRIDHIGTTTEELLRAADQRGQDTVTVAMDMAKERMSSPRVTPEPRSSDRMWARTRPASSASSAP
ncbi:Glu/Leu/Phe/Val dehydrogenase dimerization domain-containing protein [Actinomadura madurae]|uniref:Glu/Leu/Phe/Val dehydrogenase dimerization domain-containing protein n=1 Tax=Actinomadura madurae TaxID=1993 RepID=UPI0020261FF6|nr:Glu/Leu/Phe/Val dehydrogenase dimerization domain-containing protein [Actinomadura madurae]MCP9953580.1 valine dehydrogenase [Actinomadura madurae]MCP9970338.1 valine dehydrogenase [Actinomadura madurae]MCP9982815.1 valine dehydrogenase [Actinomadura madurae]MCQ0005637.1 valine dehydrogenase [Actinomadura madurae]MCQ0019049.1 valine dehydrogenase [Actinomadura madurae]